MIMKNCIERWLQGFPFDTEGIRETFLQRNYSIYSLNSQLRIVKFQKTLPRTRALVVFTLICQKCRWSNKV